MYNCNISPQLKQQAKALLSDDSYHESTDYINMALMILDAINMRIKAHSEHFKLSEGAEKYLTKEITDVEFEEMLNKATYIQDTEALNLVDELYKKGSYSVDFSALHGNTLYVIGNGFDLNYKLKTDVDSFCDILSMHYDYDGLDDLVSIFQRFNVDWSEYEESLSNLDLEEIAEHIVDFPDYLSDHESDRDGVIYYATEYLNKMIVAIEESLKEMVEEANNQLLDIDEIKVPITFHPSDAIVSFNYTSTIERLYDISKVPIIHIHGHYEKGDELLFGYKDDKKSEQYCDIYLNPEDDSRDYYTDKQHECIVGFYKRMRKLLKTEKLKAFIFELKGINRVIVIGHSMADVDHEYMEMIEQILRPKEWFISQYNGFPSRERINAYSFTTKARFFKI